MKFKNIGDKTLSFGTREKGGTTAWRFIDPGQIKDFPEHYKVNLTLKPVEEKPTPETFEVSGKKVETKKKKEKFRFKRR